MLDGLQNAASLLMMAETPYDVVETLGTIVAPYFKMLAVFPWRTFRDLSQRASPKRRNGPVRNVVRARNRVIWSSNIPGAFLDDLERGWKIHGPSQMSMWAADTNPRPFTFTEAMRRLRLRAGNRWIFDVYRAHGMLDGLYCSYGSWFVVYYSDHVLKLSDELRLQLHMCGAAAVGRLQGMQPDKATGTTLTSQEQAVLRHLAQGNEVPWIARELGITQNTVRGYIKRATRKLRAKNRLHAVARAMRRRDI